MFILLLLVAELFSFVIIYRIIVIKMHNDEHIEMHMQAYFI